MTGSGNAVIDVPAGRIEAEARSVNHRFLKVSTHLSPALQSLEPAIEEAVRARVERGHVTLSLRFTRSAAAAAAAWAVDEKAAVSAAKRLRAVSKACGLAGDVQLRDVLAVPGVTRDAGADELGPGVEKAALDAAARALDALRAARAREGSNLAAECRAILARVGTARERLSASASKAPAAQRDRLHARLTALLEGSGVAPDAATLAREVAAFADRSDVSEEIARLGSHVEHALGLLKAGGAVGRKLDFLVQEFHREANTTGSKSGDPETTAVVIELKADVERLREQVQNFE